MTAITVHLTPAEAHRLYWYLHAKWGDWRGELAEEGADSDWGDAVMAKLKPGLDIVEQLDPRPNGSA